MWVPGGWGSQISRQSAYEGDKVVSPMHRPPLPPRKYSWYLFLLEAESNIHINHLIIWYFWTQCDFVSFVADMGQQSNLNLLVLNGKWSSCEGTVCTGQETFLNWWECMYAVLHAVALECFDYMYFFYCCLSIITFLWFLEHLSWIFLWNKILKFGTSGYKSSHQNFL